MVGSCTKQELTTSADEIHVLAVLPLTGQFRSRSEAHRTAIQMAFQELEDAGPLLADRQLRVWVVDSTSDKAVAAERVEAQLEELKFGQARPQVAAIISSSGAAQQGSIKLAMQYQIPHFEISSGAYWDEIIDEEDPMHEVAQQYAFSPRALCVYEAEMTADYIASRTEWQRVYLLRGTKTHDKIHTEIIRARLALLADAENPDNPRRDDPWTGEIVNEEDLEMQYPDAEGFEQWGTHVEAVKAAGADVMFFHLRGDDNNFDFLISARDNDYTPDIITCGMARKTSLLNAINPGIVDYLAGHDRTPAQSRLYFVTRGPVENERVNPFLERVRNLSGNDSPDFWTRSAYDTAAVVGLSVIAAGSTDSAAVRDAMLETSRDGTPVGYGDLAMARTLLEKW